MKRTFFTALSCMLVFFAQAQTAITLTQSNVGTLGQGTVNYHTASVMTFTAPAADTNKVWDYSSLSGGAAYSYNLLKDTVGSSSAVIDTTGFEYLNSSRGYYLGFVYDMDASGYFYAGNRIPAQNYSLGAFTTNNKDSMYIPAQANVFRHNLIPFLMTYHTTWTSKWTDKLNFSLDVTAFGLNHTPAEKVSHVMAVDSVVGWGTARIPSSNKASIPYPVLMVKTSTMSVDSFYLGGNPAPAPLLAAFQVSQAQVSMTYTERFYRAGSLTPLMYINYGSDSTYQHPQSTSYAADHVESGIASNLLNTTNFSVYPNPAANGMVYGKLFKSTPAVWTVNVTNSIGQVVKSQNLTGSGNIQFKMDMSGIRAGGLYFISVMNEKGQLAASSKVNILK